MHINIIIMKLKVLLYTFIYCKKGFYIELSLTLTKKEENSEYLLVALGI